MIINATDISHKMKNKSQLRVEKGLTESKKLTERLLDKVSLCRYKSENVIFLEQPRLRFLAIKIVEMRKILGQSESFKTKYIESFYQAIQFPHYFLLIKKFFEFFFFCDRLRLHQVAPISTTHNDFLKMLFILFNSLQLKM